MSTLLIGKCLQNTLPKCAHTEVQNKQSDEKQRTAAAIKIQSMWRGHVARIQAQNARRCTLRNRSVRGLLKSVALNESEDWVGVF